ncbi:MAG: DDE-type integrase/transposase/recombinase, partial [Sedimenticola sp.]
PVWTRIFDRYTLYTSQLQGGCLNHARLSGENKESERQLSKWQQSAVRQLRRWRQQSDVDVTYVMSPTGQRTMVREMRITIGGRTVVRQSEVTQLIDKEFRQSKSAGNKKLSRTIKETVTGISRDSVKAELRKLPIKQYCTPVFDNKAPPIPISAAKVHERHQIDLVDMRSVAMKYKGVTYQYVLSVLDVFSRFLWLRAIPKKTSENVRIQLQDIYNQTGTPSIIQCDNGGEFKGQVLTYCAKHRIKVINSSPYHPQSQGKIESSHRSWSKKVRYNITEGNNWIANLQKTVSIRNKEYHSTLKMSPFEVFYGRNVNAGKQCDRDVIHQQARKNNKDFNCQLVKQHIKRFPPSLYKVGERVLVRPSIMKRKMKHQCVNKGVIH